MIDKIKTAFILNPSTEYTKKSLNGRKTEELKTRTVSWEKK